MCLGEYDSPREQRRPYFARAPTRQENRRLFMATHRIAHRSALLGRTDRHHRHRESVDLRSPKTTEPYVVVGVIGVVVLAALGVFLYTFVLNRPSPQGLEGTAAA